MSRIFVSPTKYIQGENEILNLGKYILEFGNKVFVVVSKEDLERIEISIKKSIENMKIELIYIEKLENCTKKEMEKLGEIVLKNNCDLVVGIGGGKALDISKAVSYFAKKPIIIFPTIASTDAPCSSLTALYKDTGEFQEYLFLKNNPNLVVVDSSIIAKAPTRFLISGIGDALSTFFEARACIKFNVKNMFGMFGTNMAFAIAETCYKTLLENSFDAIESSNKNIVTPALENIIEANILMSGLGFENIGLAIAHAVHNGLTIFKETNYYTHGEKVAFGVIVQLILENDLLELEKILKFYKKIGLPTSLNQLGLNNIDKQKLMEVSKSIKENISVKNMFFNVEEEDIYNALYKLIL